MRLYACKKLGHLPGPAGHDFELVWMDGFPGWLCGCGLAEYWLLSHDDCIRRWRGHVAWELRHDGEGPP